LRNKLSISRRNESRIVQVAKCRGSSMPHNSHNKGNGSQKDSLKHDLALFTGFKSALEACYLDWDEYVLPGITYTAENNPMYHCPFTCFRHAGDTRTEVNQVSIFIDYRLMIYPAWSEKRVR